MPSVEHPPPTSLVAGVNELVASRLGVASLRHRAAMQQAVGGLPPGTVAAVAETVARNWSRASAGERVARSSQNWRWCKPQLRISTANTSPGVRLERAIVGAASRLGRRDWANQVPVASGLVADAGDRRRAIDLVHVNAPGHADFIELKIASDYPLFAAIELIGYAAIWLLARTHRTATGSALLAADTLDLRVLAPPSYYAPYPLVALDRDLAEQVSGLGTQEGVAMSFAFDVLPVELSALLPDVELMRLIDARQALHPVGAT